MKKIETSTSTFIFLHEDIDINTLSSRDKMKDLQSTNKDTYIYYFTELNQHKEIIRNKIKYHSNMIIDKIFARKCSISEIDNNTKNIFLNKYHIQGADKSNISYGAYYNNELVAVITFDDNRTFSGGKKENIYELSRFATNSKYVVIGIFSKMLNSFISQYKPIKIISFANKRWTLSNDNIYTKNGFKLVKNISQDYYYYKNNKIYHKFNFGKSQIKKRFSNTFDNDKTEFEMATELGYVRLWDLGKYKYELYLDSEQHIIFGFIYKITNTINNKIYIGQTTRSLSKRIGEYKKSLLYPEKFYNRHIQNAFIKYGFESFKFEIIDTANNIEELNGKEIEYIKQYDATNKEIGYNMESGGRNAIPDTETLEKMSKSHLGIKQTDIWKERRIAKAGTEDAKKYGKEKTIEEKTYLSEISPKFWQGKNRDQETKDKISKTKKENGLSDFQKEKLCKRVYRIDSNTMIIMNVFESTAEASKFEGVNQSTISRWCSRNKIIKGILWKY